MKYLIPSRLSIQYLHGAEPHGPVPPRCYTLTHSDATGDLFLSIGLHYHQPQISGWYTRLMRDEVLAEWIHDENSHAESLAPDFSLHLHCHVSGGLVFGGARWRDAIFRSHLPLVVECFRYGDRALVAAIPNLADAKVLVHFNARQTELDRIETLGRFDDYL